MSFADEHFMRDDPTILLRRFAEYVRPYPAKVLAKTIDCDVRTAESFRLARSWPTARHWRLIVRAFGRDVIAAVFMPEIDDTLARLIREESQLRERLDEIRRRRQAAVGGLDGFEEHADADLDRPPVDHPDLFEGLGR